MSTTSPQTRPWPAPLANAPIRATVTVPGSKSETNRALVLAALASGPSTIRNGLHARDTQLMRDGLRALGVQIDETDEGWRVTPPRELTGGTTLDCGLAGTVLRFLPPVAALATGPVEFTGDARAAERPIQSLLDAITAVGAPVDELTLPFTVHGDPAVAGGAVTVDASESSQFISGLLLAGARYAAGLEVRHLGGPIPSRPHLAMTVAMLRARGVEVDDSESDRWRVAPGPIAPLDVTIEPDLSNTAPFLAAAAITGGMVTVPGWPAQTHQAGDQLPAVLRKFGADVSLTDAGLTVHGTNVLHGVDVDLRDASELTPVIAAVAALADHTSHITGVAHIRGHETDRLAALATELERLGAHVHESHDGLTIHPKLLGGATWRTYADHRMAQAGALLGLVVTEVELDDIDCTAKTMPQFAELWSQMLTDSEAAAE